MASEQPISRADPKVPKHSWADEVFHLDPPPAGSLSPDSPLFPPPPEGHTYVGWYGGHRGPGGEGDPQPSKFAVPCPWVSACGPHCGAGPRCVVARTQGQLVGHTVPVLDMGPVLGPLVERHLASLPEGPEREHERARFCTAGGGVRSVEEVADEALARILPKLTWRLLRLAFPDSQGPRKILQTHINRFHFGHLPPQLREGLDTVLGHASRKHAWQLGTAPDADVLAAKAAGLEVESYYKVPRARRRHDDEDAEEEADEEGGPEADEDAEDTTGGAIAGPPLKRQRTADFSPGRAGPPAARTLGASGQLQLQTPPQPLRGPRLTRPAQAVSQPPLPAAIPARSGQAAAVPAERPLRNRGAAGSAPASGVAPATPLSPAARGPGANSGGAAQPQPPTPRAQPPSVDATQHTTAAPPRPFNSCVPHGQVVLTVSPIPPPPPVPSLSLVHRAVLANVRAQAGTARHLRVGGPGARAFVDAINAMRANQRGVAVSAAAAAAARAPVAAAAAPRVPAAAEAGEGGATGAGVLELGPSGAQLSPLPLRAADRAVGVVGAAAPAVEQPPPLQRLEPLHGPDRTARRPAADKAPPAAVPKAAAGRTLPDPAPAAAPLVRAAHHGGAAEPALAPPQLQREGPHETPNRGGPKPAAGATLPVPAPAAPAERPPQTNTAAALIKAAAALAAQRAAAAAEPLAALDDAAAAAGEQQGPGFEAAEGQQAEEPQLQGPLAAGLRSRGLSSGCKTAYEAIMAAATRKLEALHGECEEAWGQAAAARAQTVAARAQVATAQGQAATAQAQAREARAEAEALREELAAGALLSLAHGSTAAAVACGPAAAAAPAEAQTQTEAPPAPDPALETQLRTALAELECARVALEEEQRWRVAAMHEAQTQRARADTAGREAEQLRASFVSTAAVLVLTRQSLAAERQARADAEAGAQLTAPADPQAAEGLRWQLAAAQADAANAQAEATQAQIEAARLRQQLAAVTTSFEPTAQAEVEAERAGRVTAETKLATAQAQVVEARAEARAERERADAAAREADALRDEAFLYQVAKEQLDRLKAEVKEARDGTAALRLQLQAAHAAAAAARGQAAALEAAAGAAATQREAVEAELAVTAARLTAAETAGAEAQDRITELERELAAAHAAAETERQAAAAARSEAAEERQKRAVAKAAARQRAAEVAGQHAATLAEMRAGAAAAAEAAAQDRAAQAVRQHAEALSAEQRRREAAEAEAEAQRQESQAKAAGLAAAETALAAAEGRAAALREELAASRAEANEERRRRADEGAAAREREDKTAGQHVEALSAERRRREAAEAEVAALRLECEAKTASLASAETALAGGMGAAEATLAAAQACASGLKEKLAAAEADMRTERHAKEALEQQLAASRSQAAEAQAEAERESQAAAARLAAEAEASAAAAAALAAAQTRATELEDRLAAADSESAAARDRAAALETQLAAAKAEAAALLETRLAAAKAEAAVELAAQRAAARGQAEAEIASLAWQLAAARGEANRTQGQLTDARAELQASHGREERARRDAEAAQQQAEQLRAELASQRTAAAERHAVLTGLLQAERAKAGLAMERRETAELDLADAQEALTAAQAQAADLEGRLAEAEQAEAEAQGALTAVQANAADLEDQLAAAEHATAEARAARTAAQARTEGLEAQLSSALADADRTSADLAAARQVADHSRRELLEAQERASTMQQQLTDAHGAAERERETRAALAGQLAAAQAEALTASREREEREEQLRRELAAASERAATLAGQLAAAQQGEEQARWELAAADARSAALAGQVAAAQQAEEQARWELAGALVGIKQAQREATEDEHAAAAAALASAQAELAAAAERAAGLEQQLEAARAEAASAQAAAAQQLAETALEAERERGRAEAVTAELHSSLHRATLVQREAEGARARLEAANTNLDSARSRVMALVGQLAAARAAAMSEAREAAAAAEATEAELGRQRAAALARADELSAERQLVQERAEGERAELDTARSGLASAEASVARGREEVEGLRKELRAAKLDAEAERRQRQAQAERLQAAEERVRGMQRAVAGLQGALNRVALALLAMLGRVGDAGRGLGLLARCLVDRSPLAVAAPGGCCATSSGPPPLRQPSHSPFWATSTATRMLSRTRQRRDPPEPGEEEELFRGMALSREQQAARWPRFESAEGQPHVTIITAFAGAAKSTQARLLVRSHPHRQFLYLAFNKAAAVQAEIAMKADPKEARRSTPPGTRLPTQNFKVHTTHALAYAKFGVGRCFEGRELVPSLPTKLVQQLLMQHWGVTDERWVLPHLAAGLRRTLEAFCMGAEAELAEVHLPKDTKGKQGRYNTLLQLMDQQMSELLWRMGGQDPAQLRREAGGALPLHPGYSRSRLTAAARSLWEQLVAPFSTLPFFHNLYLKMWALSGDRLSPISAEGRPVVLLVDEAQDLNAVTRQQIYAFNGACGLMRKESWKDLGSPSELVLRQTFRFGPEVAALVNGVMKDALEEKRDFGNPSGCHPGVVYAMAPRGRGLGELTAADLQPQDGDGEESGPAFGGWQLVQCPLRSSSLDPAFPVSFEVTPEFGVALIPPGWRPPASSSSTPASSSRPPARPLLTYVGRTNAALLGAALELVQAGRSVAVSLESQELECILACWVDVKRFMGGYRGWPPEHQLYGLDSMTDLAALAAIEMGTPLFSALELVRRLPSKTLSDWRHMMEELVPDRHAADFFLVTAHKMKGDEAPVVQVADDFVEVAPTHPDDRRHLARMRSAPSASDELHLVYVAATRARTVLMLNRGLTRLALGLHRRRAQLLG
ncbi:hypothetical protein HYH03_015839 [Edaphochlamys debaryana]|uniref:Uncharacterized protein n=1 Tax=Edaphochlamys debaryana TaxID=47281 RepID=A0A835XIR3_9CHLO|nr:hypothetical protein HYH03_015839 [Edaphochlamys debaryana]|eukprot:KAG2485462.1 hypothetical protein HYH03_015839 [Edaphochlamys debaryana]